jgi:hypothetical protein
MAALDKEYIAVLRMLKTWSLRQLTVAAEIVLTWDVSLSLQRIYQDHRLLYRLASTWPDLCRWCDENISCEPNHVRLSGGNRTAL